MLRRLLGAVLLPAALLGTAVACGSDDEAPVAAFRERNPDGYHAVVLPKPYTLLDATLTDHDGHDHRLRRGLARPITLLFFGYTHCPDICQVIMNDITAAIARLDEAHREQVGMLFLTSDPARDDPATLRAYLSRFNPDFVGLTGPIRTIEKVGHSVGVVIEEGDPLPGGGYAVAHGTHIIGVRRDGSAPLVWTDGTSSADLADDLTKALDAGLATVGSQP